MLTNRIMLGELIDSTDQNPWRNITLADQLKANKPLARRAARESVVLLRNRQGVLPLSAAKLRSVAVVGPSADSASAYIGDCASHPRQTQHRFCTALAGPALTSRARCSNADAPQPAYYTTAFSGAREALPGATVTTAPGCADIFCSNETLFPAAIAAAGKAKDLVIYVGGLNGTFNYAVRPTPTRTRTVSQVFCVRVLPAFLRGRCVLSGGGGDEA